MPATLLLASKVQRRHGQRVVIDGADLRIAADSRIGLIGPNGSGKTTLLRVLALLDAPDSGTVSSHGTVGLLRQTPERSQTGRETILEQIGVTAASAELEHQARRLEQGELDAIGAHADALERWLALGGPDAEARLQTIAGEFGLDDELLERPLARLSGGQASRVGLAAIALAQHDLILLDEPTNHLDRDGIAKLSALLAGRHGGIVIATHDRQLLSDSCTEIVSIDRRSGKLDHFHGGYAAYERERDAAHQRALAEHEQAVAERRRLQAADQEIRARAARALKAAGPHSSPDNDKFAREYVKARGEGMQNRARKLASRIDQIEVPGKPWEQRPLRLELTAAQRRQPWIVTLEQACWRRGDNWQLGPLDLTIAAAERLLLTGPNGSGKSTILATIAGRLRPTRGSVRSARSAVIAELGQTRGGLLAAAEHRPSTVADAVRQLTGLDTTAARNALAWFGLGSEQADQPPRSLSPGELTRAELAVLAHSRASCLLLDEPSNHLDIESVEVLEAALRQWPGALVVATHDQRMVERLALERELTLPAECGPARLASRSSA
jgi:ATPase subunit of ABC transporter with duplicated ATPase domains